MDEYEIEEILENACTGPKCKGLGKSILKSMKTYYGEDFYDMFDNKSVSAGFQAEMPGPSNESNEPYAGIQDMPSNASKVERSKEMDGEENGPGNERKMEDVENMESKESECPTFKSGERELEHETSLSTRKPGSGLSNSSMSTQTPSLPKPEDYSGAVGKAMFLLDNAAQMSDDALLFCYMEMSKVFQERFGIEDWCDRVRDATDISFDGIKEELKAITE